MIPIPPGRGVSTSREKVSIRDGRPEEAQNVHDPDFKKIEAAWHRAISDCKGERGLRLEEFPMLRQKIAVLERGFIELRNRAKIYCIAMHSSSEEELTSHSSEEEKFMSLQELKAKEDKLLEELQSSPSGEQWKPSEEQQRATKIMKETIQELVKNCNQIIVDESELLNISSDSFSCWYDLPVIKENCHELSLDMWEQQLLNQCINKFIYLKKVRKLIEENKSSIFSLFSTEAGNLNFEKMTYILSNEPPSPNPKTLKDSETHHRGEFAICVTFSLGAEKKSIYFKNRDARLDARVIRLFQDLNKLFPDERSLDVQLRCYQIENMGSPQNPFSVWECIFGIKLLGGNANLAVASLVNKSKKAILELQLFRLESICSALNISDLHLDNLIFENMESENPQIVPIDLESIQPGNDTGLFDEVPIKKIPSLKQREKELIDTCMHEMKEFPRRAVLINTGVFLGALTRVERFINITKDLINELKDNNWKIVEEREVLEFLILKDFLNNDVPYLTEYKSGLYYGTHIDGTLIARR